MVKGENTLDGRACPSFDVLIRELQSLCLDVGADFDEAAAQRQLTEETAPAEPVLEGSMMT